MLANNRPRIVPVLAAVAMCLIVAACGSSMSEDSAAEPSAAAVGSSPVVVVLDGSESMLTADAPGPRIDAARDAVSTFVEGLPSKTPFGLVAYGNTKSAASTPQAEGCEDVHTVIDLAPIEKSDANSAIAGVAAMGWTPLATALEQGSGLIGNQRGSLVLVSDGESTCAPDPCDTAAELRRSNPELSISTIGFKSSSAELECVARVGGGVFVTADNAAQLTSRLAAARDAEATRRQLTNKGLANVNIGSTIDDIHDVNPSFPELSSGSSSGGRVTVRWMECDWVFEDSVLVEIQPRSAAAMTVDGITTGTPMSRVVELFGQPVRVDATNTTAYFAAEEKEGVALRVRYRGRLEDGTVTAIALCKCLSRPQTTTQTQNCGPTDAFPGQRVFATGTTCQSALQLIESYLADPRTQRGDRGAQMGEWACNIQGAAEVESGEPVVRCTRPDGSTAAVQAAPEPAATGQQSTGGGCPGLVDGRSGTITITGGNMSCAAAQQMARERDGQIGYFKGPHGDPWACGSGDILAEYECYSVNGTERFEWEPY